MLSNSEWSFALQDQKFNLIKKQSYSFLQHFLILFRPKNIDLLDKHYREKEVKLN